MRLKLPGGYTPRGLQCQEHERDGGLLFERLCNDARCTERVECGTDAGCSGDADLTLVVDYIEIGQGIPCDLDAFESRCQPPDGGVTPCDVVHRDCIPVTAGHARLACFCDHPGGAALRELLDAVHGTHSDVPVTTNAPNGTVMVRVTYVQGDGSGIDCDVPVDPPFDPDVSDDLLGCVFSCPVSLDDIESAVILHYSAPNPCLIRDVARCANFPESAN